MAKLTRIVIADDHPPTRLGVRDALETSGCKVVAEAANADEAVAATKRLKPDIALLDIRMPGGGIAATETISREVPETAVVMLTVSRDDADLFDALKAGAVGYLPKDIDPDRLGDALRASLKGEAALPRSLVTRLVDEFRTRENRRKLPLVGGKPVRLTEREWEVLDAMREGSTTAQIADAMSVSPVTIRTHVSAILRKLRVTSREDAVRLVEER